MENWHTYLIPMQFRGPLPNATQYFSIDSPFGALGLPSHLSGTKSCGLGYSVSLNCTSRIVIEVGVPGGIIQSP